MPLRFPQAFTPAFTLALLAAMGSEPLAPYVVAAVLMIAVGTGGSVLIESSTPAFHLLGFLSFVMSSCSEAGRVVLFQVRPLDDPKASEASSKISS